MAVGNCMRHHLIGAFHSRGAKSSVPPSQPFVEWVNGHRNYLVSTFQPAVRLIPFMEIGKTITL